LDFGREVKVADELKDLVEKLTEAHGENLKSVVLYGSAVNAQPDEDRPKKVLVVLDRIAPDDLKSAHSVAEWWRSEGNPVPVYFTSEEMADSSDVFPIEFLDMSQVRRVVFGKDPFDGLAIPTQNLRHQLEYELRARLLRLRRLYIPASRNANQLARLMAESLDNFAVLFRHVLVMLGKEAPFNRRECVQKLAEELKLDANVLTRIFDYGPDKEVWLESETNETFAKYLAQIDKVIDTVDKG
jgi:predicted nucleotidyltransferase